MSPLDARWLLMESDDTPMHVGTLAIFHKPRNAPIDYLSQLAGQMREEHPVVSPWNLRLRHGRRLSLRPQLVAQKTVDLDYHFRHSALPAPGGERELGMLVSRLHSNALERDRPLWEFHLIEGLENNRFAIYAKLHHSIIEGVNAVPVMEGMLSTNPRRRHMPPLWSLDGAEDDSGFDLSGAGLAEIAGSASQSVLSAGRAMGAAARRVAAPMIPGNKLTLPTTAPRSTLNRAINCQRRFATQQYDLERIKPLAAGTGSTINDIVAYLAGSALRRFFKEYNALPTGSLVGLVPVNLKGAGKRRSRAAIIGLRVSLATDIADPMARLKAIQQSVSEAEDQLGDMPVEAADAYAMITSMPIMASQLAVVGPLMPQLFNVGISAAHGSDQPLYFNGAKLDAIYPMALLTQFSALSINCTSYAGTLNIGLTGARDTLPHLQRLAVYMGQALDDLEEIYTARRARA
jgi:WS/DGAT/MGAT family acyltransferase